MKNAIQLLGIVIVLCWAAAVAAQPPNSEETAQLLVNRCAAIKDGELVLIAGGTRDLLLLEEAAVEARKRGAHPLVALQTDRLTRRLFTEVPAKYDAQEPEFLLRLAEVVDAMIYVDPHEEPNLLADIPPERRIQASRANVRFEETLLKRGVRQVHLGNGLYPTKALAEQFNVPQDQLAEMFWRAVNADYRQLEATGKKVQNRLAAGTEVEITASNGTHLTMKIAQRPVYASDGIVSPEDWSGGRPTSQVWLPAGEVYLTPVPGTANGTFIADHHFFEGQYIEGLKLEIKDGRLTTMTAKGDVSALQKRFDAAPEGREVFSFLDIGINPNIESPKGSRMVTWMGAGAIAVGVGDNTWAGGENNVPFWLDVHLMDGTLKVDGEAIVEGGKLAPNLLK